MAQMRLYAVCRSDSSPKVSRATPSKALDLPAASPLGCPTRFLVVPQGVLIFSLGFWVYGSTLGSGLKSAPRARDMHVWQLFTQPPHVLSSGLEAQSFFSSPSSPRPPASPYRPLALQPPPGAPRRWLSGPSARTALRVVDLRSSVRRKP